MIERGRDPRRYAMLAFGGAGPAHASRVARILGLNRVIVPPASGAASALGFLVTPLSFEFVHSFPGELETLDWGRVDRLYLEMEARGRAMLAEGGVGPSDVSCERRGGVGGVGGWRRVCGAGRGRGPAAARVRPPRAPL